MHITWHGQYTIKVQSGEQIVVFDPYSPVVGLGTFRAKANVVALSHPSNSDMSSLENIQGSPLIIDSPGEYSVLGFSLNALGWHASDGSERSLQRWTIEDVVLLHLGALDRDLTDTELQELEKTDIDVLFLPVGGGTSLTTEQALGVLKTIEPKLVIPIHYQLDGLKEKLVEVEQFAKEMGIDPKKREKKYIVKAKQLPQDDLQTILLAP